MSDWRSLVQHAPVAVALLDAAGRIAYANPRAEALCGAPAGELAGTDALALVPQEDRERAATRFAELLAGGAALASQRWTLLRLDGERVPVEINVSGVTVDGAAAVQIDLRDITGQLAAEEALRSASREVEARQAFTDAVLDSVDVGIVACDAAGRLTVFNECSKAWHGIDPSEHPEKAENPDGLAEAFDLLDASGMPLPADRVPLLRALRDGSVEDAEMVISPHDRPATRVLCNGRALRAPDGRLLGAVVAMTNITASREQTRALEASEQRFRTTFDNDPSGLAVLTAEGRPLQVNRALCRLLDRSAEELLASEDLRDLATAEDRDALGELMRDALRDPGASVSTERRLARQDGREVWALLTFTELPGAHDGAGVLLQVENITDRKLAEQRLTRQALYDSLTDLPNRTMLLDRAERALERGVRRGEAGVLAALFCDLDGFKAINDQHGHAAGDHVLVEVALRLSAAVRPGDTVARLGGDEFVVLCESLAEPGEASRIAARLERALAAPIAWRSDELVITTSVGIAVATPAMSAEELVRHADIAMYEAKRLGKNRHEVFDDGLRARSAQQSRVEADLRAALEDDGLVVVYQPVVELDSERICGLEALARVRRPDGTLGLPADFLFVAEDTGLILELGLRVLRTACADVGRWRAETDSDLQVSVNVAARQVARDDLAEVVAGALDDGGLPAAALALELTEAVLLEAARAARTTLAGLRDLGVGVAVDAFGADYASLRYLRELPVSAVKVDRSLLAGTADRAPDEVMVLAIAGLAAELELGCTVVGVETEAQLERIAARAPRAQGFLLGRPAGAAETGALLRERLPAQT